MIDCDARLQKLELENVRLKRAIVNLVRLDMMGVSLTLALQRNKFDEAEQKLDEISSVRTQIIQTIALDPEEAESISD